jgi:hypothetical protein
MKHFQKLVEEYKWSDEKRRSDMWLMFIGLRDRFDQMERRTENIYPKFVVELCNTWCEDWKKSL